MSRTARNADFGKYEGDKPARVDDGCPTGMSLDYEDVPEEDSLGLGFTREEGMETIFSDPILDIAASLDGSQTSIEASRKCVAEYFKKYPLLGVTRCSKCGKLNYEGDQHCSGCGISLMK